MNSKTIGAVLLGIAVGVGVGFLVWHDEGTGATPPVKRGEWPNVPCPLGADPPTMAFQICDQITDLAMAVQPVTEDSQYCAVKAQAVKSATPLDEVGAAEHLNLAHEAAKVNDWVQCKRELDTID